MTQRLLQHPDRHDVAARPPTARVQLKPPTPATGALDEGVVAKKPRPARRDSGAARGGLSRLRPIARVLYHLEGWGRAPKRMHGQGASRQLKHCRYQPVHTVYILGINRSGLRPARRAAGHDPGSAHAAMTTAATADNTSTSDDLLPTDAMNG